MSVRLMFADLYVYFFANISKYGYCEKIRDLDGQIDFGNFVGDDNYNKGGSINH